MLFRSQSNWAFDQFDATLGKTLDINQRAFDDSVKKGFTTLSGYETQAAVVSVLIALLTFLGMYKRIREYM